MNIKILDSGPLVTDNEERTEAHQSPITRIMNSVWEADRTLMCDWLDSLVLAQELMGYLIDGSGTTDYILQLGHKYPHISVPPEASYTITLLADSVSIRPTGKSSEAVSDQGEGVADWTKAVLDVHYSLVPVNRILALVEETFEPEAEFLTTPNEELWWNVGNTVALKKSESPGKLVYASSWTYMIKRLSSVPSKVYNASGEWSQYPDDTDLDTDTLASLLLVEVT